MSDTMSWLKVWMICLMCGMERMVASQGLTGIGDVKRTRCSYHKAYGMQGAYCSELNFHAVPTSLKPNIEILDLSINRIRSLRNSTFQRYTSLRFIYLSDNLIQTIEPGAFDPVPNLETLDLSINGLTTIPEFVLNLPSLKKLYVATNELKDLNEDLKTMNKPFQAPIYFLSLHDCELKEFPDFGAMPELEHLNVSSNKFRNLSPTNFATFCGLKKLDLTNAMYTQDLCTLKILSDWFRQKEVTLIPDIDVMYNTESEDAKKCTDVQFEEDDLRLFMECKSTVKTSIIERKAKKMWTIIGACVGGGLLAFIIILYWLHRRNVNKTKSQNKKNNRNENKASNTLLNDVS